MRIQQRSGEPMSFNRLPKRRWVVNLLNTWLIKSSCLMFIWIDGFWRYLKFAFNVPSLGLAYITGHLLQVPSVGSFLCICYSFGLPTCGSRQLSRSSRSLHTINKAQFISMRITAESWTLGPCTAGSFFCVGKKYIDVHSEERMIHEPDPTRTGGLGSDSTNAN